MGEVRTAPCPAAFVKYADFFDSEMRAKAGTICESEEDPNRWYYGCPCGCGASGALRVGTGVKPEGKPTWLWNGSKEKPTLHPSVYHIGHWHGWLRDGIWVSV